MLRIVPLITLNYAKLNTNVIFVDKKKNDEWHLNDMTTGHVLEWFNLLHKQYIFGFVGF